MACMGACDTHEIEQWREKNVRMEMEKAKKGRVAEVGFGYTIWDS